MMQRIVIVGSGGAGKSTLANSLGKALELNVFHLDSYYWKANWIRPTNSEWLEIQQQLVSLPKWIIDGNYIASLELRLKAADTIIFLDLSRYLCIFRVVERRLYYNGKTRPDMSPECIEKLSLKFLWWILWRFPRTERQMIISKLQFYCKSKQVFIFQNPKEIAEFLYSL